MKVSKFIAALNYPVKISNFSASYLRVFNEETPPLPLPFISARASVKAKILYGLRKVEDLPRIED